MCTTRTQHDGVHSISSKCGRDDELGHQIKVEVRRQASDHAKHQGQKNRQLGASPAAVPGTPDVCRPH